MDATNLTFEENTFDVVIDKGTFDSILCSKNSFLKVVMMLGEIQKVLKNKGIYILISSGKPDNRIFHLERDFLSFDINIFTIKKEYNLNIGKYEKVLVIYLIN